MTDTGHMRKAFQREYLLEYKKIFKKNGHYKLIILVSDMNKKRLHFLYKGLYLFRIMPEYFVRF